MAREAADTPRALVLPVTIASPVDVGRLIHEIEVIDEALLQLHIRSGGTKTTMPKTSRLLEKTAETNRLNLLREEDRNELRQFLTAIKEQSPVLHISFSADPSPSFIDNLMAWLRREIHPSVLLTTGLQPNIGAGCIVRSTNKQFDFSLRQDFLDKRELLLKQLAAPPLKPVAAPAEKAA